MFKECVSYLRLQLGSKKFVYGNESIYPYIKYKILQNSAFLKSLQPQWARQARGVRGNRALKSFPLAADCSESGASALSLGSLWAKQKAEKKKREVKKPVTHWGSDLSLWGPNFWMSCRKRLPVTDDSLDDQYCGCHAWFSGLSSKSFLQIHWVRLIPFICSCMLGRMCVWNFSSCTLRCLFLRDTDKLALAVEIKPRLMPSLQLYQLDCYHKKYFPINGVICCIFYFKFSFPVALCFHQSCPGHLCSGFLVAAAVWFQSDGDKRGFAAEVCLSGLLEVAWGYPWLKWIHVHTTGCFFAILTFVLMKFSHTLHTGIKHIRGTHRYSSPSQQICALHGVTQVSIF